MFTYWSSSFIVDGSWFIVHSAEGEHDPLHNWLDLRFCAKFGGFFPGGNGVSRYKYRIKKNCDSRVFAIWCRRFCAKKGRWRREMERKARQEGAGEAEERANCAGGVDWRMWGAAWFFSLRFSGVCGRLWRQGKEALRTSRAQTGNRVDIHSCPRTVLR